MASTNLSDYVNLAFRLGHLSATLGVHAGQDEELLGEWQDDIDALADRMDRLGLPQARNVIISFLEQVGDLTAFDGNLMNEIIEEAQRRMAEVEERIQVGATELREHRGSMPDALRRIISPSLFDSLPALVQEEYRQAERSLMAGDNTPAATTIVRCVEVAFRDYYSAVTGNPSGSKSWQTLEDELKANRDWYVMNAVSDVRKNYRNPVTHPGPEDVISPERAAEIFYSCSIALVRLAESRAQRDMPRSA